jgi:hypothetical protein
MRSKFRVGALLALALVVVAMTSMQTAQANTPPAIETANTALQLAGVPCQADMQGTNVATNEPAEEMLRFDGITATADAIESNCATNAKNVGGQDEIGIKAKNTKAKYEKYEGTFIPNSTIQAIRGAPTSEATAPNLALTAILPNLNSTQVPEVALTHRDNDASPATSLQIADATVSIERNLVLRC